MIISPGRCSTRGEASSLWRPTVALVEESGVKRGQLHPKRSLRSREKLGRDSGSATPLSIVEEAHLLLRRSKAEPAGVASPLVHIRLDKLHEARVLVVMPSIAEWRSEQSSLRVCPCEVG